MNRRDFIKNSVGLAGILTTHRFPNILYGQVELDKLVTDPVVEKIAISMGLDINKGDVTFEADYDISHRMFAKPYHSYSKLYGINAGDQQGAAIQVISGLPMVRQIDGIKCLAKLQESAGKYYSAENMFDLEIDGGRIHVVPGNLQSDGTGITDYVEWDPVLKLDGNIISSISGPVLLPVDPVNSNYTNNTLQWNYGICLRRVRVIEGKVLERWVFFSNPGGEIRIEHNHEGKANFRIGGGLIDVIDGDIEVVTAKTFNEARYPFEIAASATYNPTDGSYEDANMEEVNNNQSWATLVGGNGDSVNDTAADGLVYYRSGSVSGWQNIARSGVCPNSAALPDDCAITATVLSWCGNGQAAVDANGSPSDINAYAFTPVDVSAIAVTDYANCGSTPFCDSGVAFGSWDKDDYNDFTFNATGRAAVSKTGVSKFMMRFEDDATETPPASGGISKSTYARAYFVEQGAGFKPKLAITYTEGINIFVDGLDGSSDIETVDGLNAASDIETIDGLP